MALMTTPNKLQCSCGNAFYSTNPRMFSFEPVKDGCPDCKARTKAEADAAYYAELDALPMEERVRRIEKWIREFRHPAPVYVSPPTF